MNRMFILPVIISISIFLVVLGNKVNAQEEESQILETNKVTLTYPAGWTGEANTNRFDSEDFTISDNSGEIQIMGFDGSFDSKYYQRNPDAAYDSFVRGSSNSLISPTKVQSYEIGEITIGDIPAYATLYGGKMEHGGDFYGFLITLAFYNDNDRYYAVLVGAPSDTYDSVEPEILNILKSISLKE